jgi:hypothetical protein
MKRAFILGSIFSIGIACLEPYLLMIIQGSGLCADYMVAGAFLSLLVVILIFGILSFIHKKFILSSSEMVLIFFMVSIACVIPSWGFMGNLFGVIAGLKYFATPANNWNNIFINHIKSFFLNTNMQSIIYFYNGYYGKISPSYASWITPLISWFILIFIFYFLSVCISVIFRKQWIENERLIFPLAIVPLEVVKKNNISERIPTIFKNKVFWIGFGIAFFFLSINGVLHYFPIMQPVSFVQMISIFRNTESIIFLISFVIIGFAYFLPTDIAFSLWFFYLLSAIESGWFNISGFSLPGYNEVYAGSSAATSFQGGGAMLILFLFVLWIGRKHLKDVFQKAFGKKKEINDKDEMLSYRTAVFGGLISICLLLFVFHLFGMPFFVSILFIFFVLVIFIGLTRIIAQAGIGFARATVIPPDFTAYSLPPSVVTANGYTALGLQYVWAADIRTQVLTSTIDGLKMNEEAKIKPKIFFFSIIVAIGLSYFFSAWTTIHLGYIHGALNAPNGWFYGSGFPSAVGTFISSKITNPLSKQIIISRLIFVGIGAICMLFLIFMHQTFLWWPLNYIGLPIADSWAIRWAWFSIFLAWIIKIIILRYGGAKIYYKTIPFFIGLILGSIGAMGVWILISVFAGQAVNPILIGVP